jgi:hypothetical protein
MITLPFALYLAIHRHGKGHTVGQQDRPEVARGNMSREQGVAMIDECQKRSNHQRHLEREVQRIAFQTLGQQGWLFSRKEGP